MEWNMNQPNWHSTESWAFQKFVRLMASTPRQCKMALTGSLFLAEWLQLSLALHLSCRVPTMLAGICSVQSQNFSCWERFITVVCCMSKPPASHKSFGAMWRLQCWSPSQRIPSLAQACSHFVWNSLGAAMAIYSKRPKISSRLLDTKGDLWEQKSMMRSALILKVENNDQSIAIVPRNVKFNNVFFKFLLIVLLPWNNL